MDVEGHSEQEQQQHRKGTPLNKGERLIIAILSLVVFSIGITGGYLLILLYFRKGGKRQWLNSFLQTAGWPIVLLPLLASYHRRRRRPRPDGQPPAKLFLLTPRQFAAFAVLGLVLGLDDFLYAYGLIYLPVSTSALLVSTQLVFTALFAFLIVRQKFTPYSINSVALMTVGAVMLAVHANSDRPEGVTKGDYLKGFFLTLGAAAIYGLLLPLVELMYAKNGQGVTYTVVMESQLVMGFFATAFCTVGMIVNKDFQAIPTEAKNYELGEVRYYTVLVWTSIMWQFYSLGAVGIIFTVHTLLTGILIAAFIPITQVFSVVLFHEKFSSDKGFALVFCIWGLASYSYGEYRSHKKQQRLQRIQGEELVGEDVPSNS